MCDHHSGALSLNVKMRRAKPAPVAPTADAGLVDASAHQQAAQAEVEAEVGVAHDHEEATSTSKTTRTQPRTFLVVSEIAESPHLDLSET